MGRQAEAEDIISQLDDGADFAELAPSKLLTTPGALSMAGPWELAFTKENSGYVEEFAAAAF